MFDGETYQTLLRAGLVALLSTIATGLIIYLVARLRRLGKCSVLRCQLASLACSMVILGCFALSVSLVPACGPFGPIFLIGGLVAGVMLTLPLMGRFFPEGRSTVLWGVYIVGMPLVVVLLIFSLQQILD
jgi:hypothetical protein